MDLSHAHLPQQLQVSSSIELEPSFEVPLWFTHDLDPLTSMKDDTEPLQLSYDFGNVPPATSSFN